MPVVRAAAAGSAEWFAQRRAGITATDLPKILGLSQYGNALSVWHDKRGTLPEEPAGEAALWGTLLEDTVAREWARRRGVRVRRTGVWVGAESWMRASPDRLVVGTGEALEVKTRSAFVMGKWSDGIPDDVLAQVAWQRLVCGFTRVHVAVLFGQSMREYEYGPDAELEALLVREARAVWGHVVDDTPPAAPMDAVTARLLEMMQPCRDGVVECDAAVAWQIREAHGEATRLGREADAAKGRARALCLSALGGGEVLECDGAVVASFKETARGNRVLRIVKENDSE